MITKGMKVSTLFGTGIVLGFEVRGRHGKSLPPSDTPESSSSRVVVQLDNPEKWIMNEPGVYPHFPIDSIHPVEELCSPSAQESKESPAVSK